MNKDTYFPDHTDDSFYWERVDRNLGIISTKEQKQLRDTTIGIAGCGGMGGLVAAQFARLGVGHLKIADCETFDVSNINRQFSARHNTVGHNKAEVTAYDIHLITPDVRIDVYNEGITEDTVEDFVGDCDIICDEIEFFGIKPRFLLHQTARRQGISLFCCDVIGFGTRIFFFTPTSMTMEEFLGVTGDETDTAWLTRRLLERFAPELPPDISEDTVAQRPRGRG